jgi:hypothetical protein
MDLVVMIALPAAVFFGGARLMAELTGRGLVLDQLELIGRADRRPLTQRMQYDVTAVRRHWAALNETALRSEQHFLVLDLVFPFAYGGALAVAALIGWAWLGRVTNPAWVLAPVVLAVLSDWTENFVHYRQLGRYLTGGADAVQSGWIQLASAATSIKLLCLTETALLLVVLAGILLARALRYGV